MFEDTLDFAARFNHAEALLWWGIALILGLRFILAGTLWRSLNWMLPMAFAVFGLSDWIEARTGAWWDPWWLLVMKAACVAVFLGALLQLRKAGRGHAKKTGTR
ncbi:MAG: hypothetical protein KDK97_22080 [Verrucomicrobiales bacterium]|nr:hypothetical protein [Verrucomicrobiales bacterium]